MDCVKCEALSECAACLFLITCGRVHIKTLEWNLVCTYVHVCASIWKLFGLSSFLLSNDSGREELAEIRIRT